MQGVSAACVTGSFINNNLYIMQLWHQHHVRLKHLSHIEWATAVKLTRHCNCWRQIKEQYRAFLAGDDKPTCLYLYFL